jgi:acyl-CoA thioester hydrolase
MYIPKEVKYGDVIFMSVKVAKLRKDYSRFTFLHEVTKEDGTLCAILTVDGAWMDTVQRKLITPPQYIIDMCDNAPKPNDFQWIESAPK